MSGITCSTVHTLTGCDYISKVGTKHVALKANPKTYLKQFGRVTDDMDSLLAASEEYLTQVLKKGTWCRTIDQLRSYIYHHGKRVCFDQHPPTSYAMRVHILRAFYATNQIVSLLSPSPILLDPTHYGFAEVHELLMPDTDKNPIPEEFEVDCNCGKCANERCRCREKCLPCCRFCKCQRGLEQGSEYKYPSGTQQ